MNRISTQKTHAYRITLVLLLLASLGLGGCVKTNVKLNMPARKAPFAERTAAYQQARLMGHDYATRVEVKNGRSRSHELLFFGNGEELIRFEDLLQGVEPNSRTADAVLKVVDAERTATLVLTLGMTGSLLSGGTLGVIGIGATQPPVSTTLVVVGGVIVIVGPVVSFFVSLSYYRKAMFFKAKALKTYDTDLMYRLRIAPK